MLLLFLAIMATVVGVILASTLTAGYSQEKDSGKVLSVLGSSPPMTTMVLVAAESLLVLVPCRAMGHDTSSSGSNENAICIITLAGSSSSSNSSSWCLVSGHRVRLKLVAAADDMSVVGWREVGEKEE